MPVHSPSIFVLNGHRAHWTPLISGLCGWMMETVLAYFGERKGMCKGKQELELLGKHKRDARCLSPDPSHSNSTAQVPFHTSVMWPPGWIHSHKMMLELSQGLRGSSGAQQESPKELGNTQSVPWVLWGHATHRHHCWSPRGVLGNEANGGLLLLGSLLWSCQFSLNEKEWSRFSDFSTYAHIVRGGDDAGPIWDVPVFIIFTIVVPICPSGFWVPEYFAVWIISARPCTLCLAHPVPGKMTSIEFMIMQVFYSLQMFYLLQWLLIAALTNSVEAKQASTTAFFFFYLCVWNKKSILAKIWISGFFLASPPGKI